MEALVLVLAFVLMLVGVVGVLVPVLPGLFLIWVVGVASLLWQGGGPSGWAVVAWLTLLLVAGTAATLVLPARRGRQAGATPRSLASVVLGAILGFLVLPVFGLLLGALAGLYLGEWGRLGDRTAAWVSTKAVLAAYGVGVLVKLVVATIMLGSWAIAVVVRAV